MSATAAPHREPPSAEQLRRLAHASPEEALAELGSGPNGLDPAQLEARQAEYGPNQVAHERAPAWYLQLAGSFWTPFTGVLVILGLVSLATGDRRAVVVIGAIVGMSGILRFVQEYRSNRAALALQALVRTRATVERRTMGEPGSGQTECPIVELVPGDVVHLSAGDMVPADVRLLGAKDLFVSQAALTGESLPVEKHATVPESPLTGAPPTLPELPTVCFMGTSVISGSAAAVVVATGPKTYFGSMAHSILGRRPVTSFDQGVNRVSWLLIRFMLVMVPVVFLVNGLTKHDWVSAFLFGIAVAVGLTPEMLPMVVTANLAKGAVAMARQKTIVKRLNAIQNLGAMDVLCTDKTGTLTQDRIVLRRHLDAAGQEDDRVLELAYLNSHYQTGLKNLLDVAVLEHTDLNQRLVADARVQKVDEIPWDFSRRRMSVVVAIREGVHEVITKGAVEEILAVCRAVQWGEKVEPLTEESRRRALEVSQELNQDGFRVVAVAYRDFPAAARAYSVADEAELVLAGFIGFLDPPKETARPALEALKVHGVAVKILTGDNDVITRTVCRQVGIEPERIVLGHELEGLDGEALAELADRTAVFAKLAPAQKNQVVGALRRRGHVVGFLGDGINDAGALHEADVGISVDSAVDIAKESADIVLLEKSLLVLERGVVEGRRTFGNIIKYVKMAASSNFGNVLSVLIASAFLPFLPMLPIQLLIQNLLYDISQTSIPFDGMDPEYLAVPRQWRADDIGRFMLWIGPISSVFDVTTFLVLWYVLGANTVSAAGLFQSGWFVEGLLSQALIVHMIRTAKVPFVQSRAAAPVLALTAIVMMVGIALPFTGVGHRVGLQPLPSGYFGWLGVILVAYMLLTQVVKRIYIRRFGTWL